MDKLLLRRALRAPANIRGALNSQPNHIIRQQYTRNASSVPTIAQSSFWKSLIPKPLRRRKDQPVDWRTPKKHKSKEWNPATFYIVIFLFIGSMSIQMIALRRDFNTFMRRSEVRIGLLRELIEKLQKGEEVDVEKTLGTGDAEKEEEWEEVLREIERDDILKNAKKVERTKQSLPPIAKTESTPETASTTYVDQAKSKTGGYSSFF